MRNFFLACALLLFPQLHAQTPAHKLENLGLIAELSYMKTTAEHLAQRVMNDPDLSASDKTAFAVRYGELRVMQEQLILQLSAEIVRKKKIRYFRKLNNLLVIRKAKEVDDFEFINRRLKNMAIALRQTNEAFNELVKNSPKTEAEVWSAKIPSVGELPGLALQDAQKHPRFRTRRFERILRLLDELRILPLDLLSNKGE